MCGDSTLGIAVIDQPLRVGITQRVDMAFPPLHSLVTATTTTIGRRGLWSKSIHRCSTCSGIPYSHNTPFAPRHSNLTATSIGVAVAGFAGRSIKTNYATRTHFSTLVLSSTGTSFLHPKHSFGLLWKLAKIP